VVNRRVAGRSDMAAEMLIVAGHTIDRVRAELAWAKVRD
jgi:hypothetical protein